MKYISVCSGIEAATVAWHDIGWEPVAFAEIDAFPSAVLAHHFPTVPNLGDISKVDWRPYNGAVDLVVGGTPCQSFSIAGRREGLAGSSGLVFEYFRLLREVQPRWFVWENVPGSFSSNKGADFQSILREWDKLGYHVSWATLDAQYFGVPQRRRRIFAVGHLGDWRYPAQVLFEPDCLRGHTAKSGKARKGSAAHAESGTRIDWPARVDSTLNAHFGEKMGLENQHIHQGAPLFVPVAFQQNQLGEVRTGNVAGTLNTNSNPSGRNTPMICGTLTVRRLTPTECERLQGFPEGWTDIPWRGKDHAPDGPRYKALGNSMAVPCMRWIGERINNIEHQE